MSTQYTGMETMTEGEEELLSDAPDMRAKIRYIGSENGEKSSH